MTSHNRYRQTSSWPENSSKCQTHQNDKLHSKPTHSLFLGGRIRSTIGSNAEELKAKNEENPSFTDIPRATCTVLGAVSSFSSEVLDGFGRLQVPLASWMTWSIVSVALGFPPRSLSNLLILLNIGTLLTRAPASATFWSHLFYSQTSTDLSSCLGRLYQIDRLHKSLGLLNY